MPGKGEGDPGLGFDLGLKWEKSGLRGSTSGRIPIPFGASWRESPARLWQNPGIKNFSKSNIPTGASNKLPPSLRGHRVRGWIQGIPGAILGAGGGRELHLDRNPKDPGNQRWESQQGEAFPGISGMLHPINNTRG